MTCFRSSDTTKKLLLQFIKESADYYKRCSYLQEIIHMGKKDDVWRKALIAYLDTSVPDTFPSKTFSKN
ncbi:MAG TPA: hypothetical protein VI461_03075 [Chitinophagaceae bacterium]|nr:hypothetical protein [Chitinophagaceae bacterium]